MVTINVINEIKLNPLLLFFAQNIQVLIFKNPSSYKTSGTFQTKREKKKSEDLNTKMTLMLEFSDKDLKQPSVKRFTGQIWKLKF